MSVRTLALLLLAASPITLRAQQSVLETRLDPATYEALKPVLDQARRDSIPLRALEAKALEGVAKKRPGSQIVAVVQRLAAELREARGLLVTAAPGMRRATAGEVVAVAEALRRGVAPGEITTLRNTTPPDTPLEIPFAVLGELVQRGVPAEQARGVIEQFLASRVPQERLVEVPDRMDVALRVGAPPVAALGSALQGLGIPMRPITPGPRRPNRPPAGNP